MTKYSVLMSVYRNEKSEFLEKSLDSMIRQTIPPDEIVLVQDGPLGNDLTTVIQKYTKLHPNVLTNVVIRENVGLGSALTLGLRNCRNEFVARMDTDDISLPERCELQLAEFEKHPELDIIGTFSSDFEDDPENLIATREVPITQQEIYERAKRRSPFNHVTVMFRKSTVLRFGGYSDFRRCQDVDLFGRMIFGGCKASNIDKVLVLVRLSPDRMKRRRSWLHVKNVIRIRRNFFKRGYVSLSDYLLVAILQVVAFFTPLSIQKFIYANFLRRKVR